MSKLTILLPFLLSPDFISLIKKKSVEGHLSSEFGGLDFDPGSKIEQKNGMNRLQEIIIMFRSKTVV